jgi:serine/threonine protein kinase
MASPFGRYLLLEQLAAGGMAVVYRAVLRDPSGFEKIVALKRVRKDLSTSPEFIARFVDEARIVSTLSHSNIAQVFDFGQVEGEFYLAMEYVDGPDLGALLQASRAQGQPIPIPTAVHIAARVARGLGAAHARLDEGGRAAPVVHRDVSPQNVLLSRSGEIKVVDFGIALAAEKALRTRTGIVVGKCRYMAPEQAAGHELDPRADVFAAGCVLFEMLSGAALFSGATPEEVLQQVVALPIPSASSRNPDVPPELDEIVARALMRPRERRYTDGTSLARDLESLLHHMVPEYSRDDLASFIRVAVPARHPPAWEAAATVEANADGPTDPADLAPTEPRAEPAATGALEGDAVPAAPEAADAAAVALADQTTAPLSATAGPAGAAARDPPCGGHGSAPSSPAAGRPAPTVTSQGQGRRAAVLFGVAAVLGLLVGAGGGWVFDSRAVIAPMVHLTLNAAMGHGRWTLTVLRVERTRGPDGARLLVALKLDHAGHFPSGTARAFSLRSGRSTVAPIFSGRAEPRNSGLLWLVFPCPPEPLASVVLRFAPPGERAVELRLPL